ncbi:WAT1-related protein At3g28050-like isoform X2 [Cicer arietinum]|uniref:WAT1-related protein n=1 Tax=Cicer arietinum TaxID=3827 RepID=A0A1S2YDI2_CICAR|nr:WAT1-related protein At3g28050-like isoform X2 [Cicer arietinum]
MCSNFFNHFEQTSYGGRNDKFRFHFLLKFHRCPHSSSIFILHPQISTSSNHFFHPFSILHTWITRFIFSYLAQAFGYAGINYSSATLGTAMLNLVPGFTFILAILFGMEQLDWRSSSSLAKLLGTIVSISGAFVATLYKGVALLNGPSPANLSQHQVFSQDSNWILGGLFLAADCVMASAFTIVQASVLKKYPAELIVVFFYCFFVAILSAMTCLVVKSDIGAWSLEPNFRLLAVLYSGVIGSAFQVGVITWCLHQTGPVFVSMFKPIGIVISVVIGVVFLGDAFYLGSLIGAVVIVIGFYSVLWGKSKDIEARSLESRGNQTLLLKDNSSEDI